MKFACTQPYRTFRGYVFVKGNPVDVTDRGTLEIIGRYPEFKRIEDNHEEKIEAPAEKVLTASNACPKCGKALKKKGRHFHIRKCRG